jgi:ADP-L-glycero-D-manno-heptose 6-epimerase
MFMMMTGNWTEIDNGLFNLGTGNPRNFIDLANALFQSLSMEPNIKFIEMPEKLRSKYQYFTKAEMNKLRGVGYNRKFMTLEEGVADYVSKYLLNQ